MGSALPKGLDILFLGDFPRPLSLENSVDGVIKPSEQIFKTIILIKPDNIEIIFTKSQRIPDVFLRHLKVIIPFMR